MSAELVNARINIRFATKKHFFDTERLIAMNLSISNIAWPPENDEEMYGFLVTNGFCGLEIAPTRIFPQAPYDKLTQANEFSSRLKEIYNIGVSSIQSIWYGITESIFASADAQQKLIDYTKKAVDFANAVACPNLVFGCPKNRAVPPCAVLDNYLTIACDFFNKIGDYAAGYGICISIEPNPPIYNTNFINTTVEAFDLCKKLNNPGIKVNIDLGTMIHNGEGIEILKDNINLINHIHISEPYLVPIEKRTLHYELIKELQNLNYDKFISIEMNNPNNLDLVKETILYIKGLSYDI